MHEDDDDREVEERLQLRQDEHVPTQRTSTADGVAAAYASSALQIRVGGLAGPPEDEPPPPPSMMTIIVAAARSTAAIDDRVVGPSDRNDADGGTVGSDAPASSAAVF